jgi:hypothetical protein
MAGLDGTIAAYRALPNAELQVLPGTPHPIEKVDIGRIVAMIREVTGTSEPSDCQRARA